MIVNKAGLVLISFAMVTLSLAVAGYAQTQSSSSNWSPSSHTPVSRPYLAPAITSPSQRPNFIGRPFRARPVISMALPTAGPYQSGLRFASRQGFVVQPTAFSAMPPATSNSSTTTPFLTVNEQISRAGANVVQPPTSYIGGSARVTGQSMARMAVRRAANGNVGLGGVLSNF